MMTLLAAVDCLGLSGPCGQSYQQTVKNNGSFNFNPETGLRSSHFILPIICGACGGLAQVTRLEVIDES